jgi:hypothetical protein
LILYQLAQLALPLLLVRCTEVLRRYAEFIRSSEASDPNASSNRVEVVMILRNVLSCPLHPQIFTSSATATSADSMKRAGLVLVTLVACVGYPFISFFLSFRQESNYKISSAA